MPEAAHAPAPAGAVTEVNDRAGFVSLEREWDALVQATSGEVFVGHEFLRIWLDNFAPAARRRVLIARGADGTLEAALPLIAERARFHGVPVRRLSAAANAHSCRFDLIARDPAWAGRAFLEYLRADRSWDVLRLTDVPDGGAAHGLLLAAAEAGLPLGTWPSLASPYLALPRGLEALQARWHPKLRANCRRRRKKLASRGAVTFERYEGGLELDAKLEEGFALEQGGWKGQRGTAIAQSAQTRGFYCELARARAYRGGLALSFLRVGGRPAAFHFALNQGGKYLLLKPGYDEALGDCSPGQLLMEDVLADCVARGFDELDFLGPDMPWKRDWADLTRNHRWLFVFRDNTFGRALCAAKFRWAPAAKGVWARWNALQR